MCIRDRFGNVVVALPAEFDEQVNKSALDRYEDHRAGSQYETWRFDRFFVGFGSSL